MAEPLAYLNGEFVPFSQACVSIADHGFTMGVHAMELTRTFNQRLFRLDAHLERLYRTLKSIRLDPKMARDELARVTHELVARNAELAHPSDELAVIHFVTPGMTPAYTDTPADQIPPTVGMHTNVVPLGGFADQYDNGLHLVCVPLRHQPPECMDPKLKIRSRLYWYLTDIHAHMVDPAAMPLVLDIHGNIAECHGANFLMVRDGAIHSPTTRNMLEGITWQTTLELAEKRGIEIVLRDLTLHDAYNADEAFITSSTMCDVPVTKIDNLPIGDGKPGPIWRKLMDGWNELAGYDVIGRCRQIKRRLAQ